MTADVSDLKKFCRFKRPKQTFDKPGVDNSLEALFTVDDVTPIMGSGKASTLVWTRQYVLMVAQILQLWTRLDNLCCSLYVHHWLYTMATEVTDHGREGQMCIFIFKADTSQGGKVDLSHPEVNVKGHRSNVYVLKSYFGSNSKRKHFSVNDTSHV